ncbi:hypothetical protein [Lewinella sp. W8]|uniref:hypothetical protein n=1 Tax=Lewinella sp. W8 TaxID=2528208 RepID=UPI00106733C2|nr:hypothetical protein [Lewinella sp. W8]MTB53312.1 hypothetical protein [Lewinella sp. W8]
MPNNTKNSTSDHPFTRVYRRMKARDRQKFIRWLEAGAFTLRKNLGPKVQYLENGLSDRAPRSTPRGKSPTALELTYLRRELDRFLAVNQFLENPLQVKLHTARAYQKYKMEPQATKMLTARPPSTPPASIRGNLDSFLLQHELVYGGYELSDSGETLLTTDLPVALDRLYLTEKLRSACHLTALRNLRDKSANTTLLAEVLALAQSSPWKEDFLIQLYATAYRILSEPNEQDRLRLRELLMGRAEVLADTSFRDVFMVLLNDGIRQMNTGHPEYQRYCFDLFNFGLQQGILFAGKHLTAQTFSNISLTALKLREFEWLSAFFEEYGPRLNGKDQKTILPYCQASYCYEMGDLERAGDLLVGFDYSRSSTTMQLQARITLAKVYFDQDARVLLESHLHSITVFLSRHQQLGYHRQICLDFVRLCKKLLLLPERPAPKKVASLREEIRQIPVASFRDWLEERLPGQVRVHE